MKDCCSHRINGLSRREAFGLIALGGGVSLLSTLAPSIARARGHTDMLLLTCMDYRLVDDTVAYMNGRGLRDKYDHVILAGASLGALNDRFPSWAPTFWSHLEVAITLHSIHKVMVIDHRDCGAYKVILGPESVDTPDKELRVHTEKLQTLRAEIKRRHEHLEVELGLMSLDGKVQDIA
jgi:hypothetical protein